MTDKTWLSCERCGGDEGWMDAEGWHECPSCEGDGGRQVSRVEYELETQRRAGIELARAILSEVHGESEFPLEDLGAYTQQRIVELAREVVGE